LAIVLRGQEVFTNNYLFLIDQGRDMMDVKKIIFDHHITLIGPYTSLGGVFQGPIYYYLLSIPTLLTGGDPIGPLILMLLISLSAALLVYFWMNKLFGFKTAILTFLLFAVSPEAISAATYTWNPHPMWLMLVVYSFSLFETVSGKQKFHFLLWPSIGLMFHFEMALGFFILLSTISFFLIFAKDKIKNRYFIYGLVILIFTFLPQIIFELRHDFLMSRSVMEILSGKDQGLIVKGESRSYLDLLNNHFHEFVNNYNSSFVRTGILSNLPIFAFVFILFSFLFGQKARFINVKEYKFIKILASIVLIVFLLTAFYPFPIRYWFLTGFQTLYILILGVLFGRLWGYRFGKIVLILLFFYFAIHVYNRIDLLYFHPPDQGGTAKIKGKKEAIDYVYNDSKGKKFGLLVFTPPVNTDAYDYIIWWYGNKNYGYLPHKEKKGIFYLLIEKDASQPWSYKGWLETVVKTGEIIDTKTLPNGFIVQKRYQK